MREKVIKARENEDAKLEILRSFEPLIKKCIKMYVRDIQDYNDAMQLGYLTILSCIKLYNIESSFPFEAYVKRSVMNEIGNFSRKIGNDISLDAETTEDGGTLYDILESDSDIEGEYVKREDILRLGKALKTLPDKQREVIEDIFFKKMSMREVSKNKRCHYMSTVTLKERALNKLREEMKK